MCHDHWVWDSEIRDKSADISTVKDDGWKFRAQCGGWFGWTEKELEKGGEEACEDDL